MNRHFPDPTSAKARANLRRQAKKREAARATLRDLRYQARAEIDKLLSFLDASDLDPDLEPDLGFPETDLSHYKGRDQSLNEIEDGRCGAMDDREADDGELEPSLCGVTAHGLAALGHDRFTGAMAIEDGEEEAEDEPSLGFLEAGEEGHLGHATGSADDLEEQCEDEGDTSDSGIADEEGRMEQCPKLFQHSMQRVE